MIQKTWRGCQIKHDKKPMWVKDIRKGRVTWVLDYAGAKHYSEKTARRHDDNIRAGVYQEV